MTPIAIGPKAVEEAFDAYDEIAAKAGDLEEDDDAAALAADITRLRESVGIGDEAARAFYRRIERYFPPPIREGFEMAAMLSATIALSAHHRQLVSDFDIDDDQPTTPEGTSK